MKMQHRSDENRAEVGKLLVERGTRTFKAPFEKHNFTNNDDANRLLNDLDRYPHAFVIGCIMDRQVKADRAWIIPYLISQKLETFEFDALVRLSATKIAQLMSKPKPLHRLHPQMSRNFYEAVQIIGDRYDGEAGRLWSDTPPSAEVVLRFLQFPGVGPKIATMAANLLARIFKIPFADYYSIDVSADVHVRRVFRRLGLVQHDDDISSVVYAARAIHPKFPGLLDSPSWELGRTTCRPKNPLCNTCDMQHVCPSSSVT